MPGIDRTTIISGPAQITFASSTFWSKGDIILKPVFDRFDIETSAFGKVDTRLKGKKYEVTFEPDGRMTSALMAIMWPYGASATGVSIFGATDRPLVIHGRDGTKVTMVNAALTQMPSIRFGVGVSMAGPCKFTCLLANSSAVTSTAAYLTVSTAAYADTGWLGSDILTAPALCTWGSAPWAAFQVDSPGWEITPTLKLSDVGTDGFGTVDMILQGLEVSAKATPVGPTVAQVITSLTGAAELGTTIATGGTEMVITAGTTPKLITATIYNAALVEADLGWSGQRKRVGACTWHATRTVADPLFSIAIS